MQVRRNRSSNSASVAAATVASLAADGRQRGGNVGCLRRQQPESSRPASNERSRLRPPTPASPSSALAARSALAGWPAGPLAAAGWPAHRAPAARYARPRGPTNRSPTGCRGESSPGAWGVNVLPAGESVGAQLAACQRLLLRWRAPERRTDRSRSSGSSRDRSEAGNAIPCPADLAWRGLAGYRGRETAVRRHGRSTARAAATASASGLRGRGYRLHQPIGNPVRFPLQAVCRRARSGYRYLPGASRMVPRRAGAERAGGRSCVGVRARMERITNLLHRCWRLRPYLTCDSHRFEEIVAATL